MGFGWCNTFEHIPSLSELRNIHVLESEVFAMHSEPLHSFVESPDICNGANYRDDQSSEHRYGESCDQSLTISDETMPKSDQKASIKQCLNTYTGYSTWPSDRRHQAPNSLSAFSLIAPKCFQLMRMINNLAHVLMAERMQCRNPPYNAMRPPWKKVPLQGVHGHQHMMNRNVENIPLIYYDAAGMQCHTGSRLLDYWAIP